MASMEQMHRGYNFFCEVNQIFLLIRKIVSKISDKTLQFLNCTYILITTVLGQVKVDNYFSFLCFFLRDCHTYTNYQHQAKSIINK